MMHPEHMHIIVRDMQAERRLEASEPLVPSFADLGRSARRQLGAAMIRLGVLLGGTSLPTTRAPGAVFQD